MSVQIIHSCTFVVLALSSLLVSCRPGDLETTIAFPTGERITVATQVIEVENAIRITPVPTAGAHNVQTSEPDLMETPLATATSAYASNEAASTGLSFLAELPPDSDRGSPQPSHIWWSEDGKTLFFQDIINRQAWAYDLFSGEARPILYEPRSEDEIADQLAETLPPGAFFLGASPSGQAILLEIPLADPVVPDAFDTEDVDAPRFTHELQLLRGGIVQPLGLVDSCFGYSAALWTLDESQAVVNGGSVPDMPYECMFDVWLVDAEALTVGPLTVPWQASEKFSVLDISTEGKYMALRKDVNSVYEVMTQHEVFFPMVDTGRASLAVKNDEIGLLFFEAAFTPSITDPSTMHDNISYISPTEMEPRILGSVEGLINQRVLSPDGKHLAFTTTNVFGGQKFEGVQSGLWILVMP